MADKRYHNNIWSVLFVCFHVMELIGFVKNYLSAGKMMAAIISSNYRFSLIYTLKFPEIMCFTGKIKIISVIVIMDCINTDEMIEVLKKYKIFEKTMDSIAKAAYKHISSRAGKNVNCGIVMFSEKYGKLCSCGNIERIIGKIKEEKR